MTLGRPSRVVCNVLIHAEYHVHAFELPVQAVNSPEMGGPGITPTPPGAPHLPMHVVL